jgi:hypothetical protein
MSLATLNPTSNTTPDPAQGGSAVTSPTNTGHAASTSVGLDGTSQDKTAIWTGFPFIAGQVTAATLKLDWTENGSRSGGGTNRFRIEYSLNGGSSWNTAIDHANITSASGPTTFSLGLTLPQDLSTVQVRDLIRATTAGVGQSASCTGTVANIKIDVTLFDGALLMMS